MSTADPKIIDQLKDKKPQVTFSCDNSTASCTFQFWIGAVESFYCGLDECTTTHTVGAKVNTTRTSCEHLKCNCIADRMLCGQDGSVSEYPSRSGVQLALTMHVDIDDFLNEEIKGPAQFQCKTGSAGCTFEEDAMNDLIDQMFGDAHITLDCDGGECLHFSQIPGFEACLGSAMLYIQRLIISPATSEITVLVWAAVD